MTAAISDIPPNGRVKPGDIINLGPHRLMCGDSTNPQDVAALMEGRRADMVFCSPPYLQQRDYDSPGAHSWDELMRATFSGLHIADAGQIFVNLGLVHRKHQWTAYWHDWSLWMAEQGWLRLGWYIWDKMDGLPTVPAHGRLYPCHEFIFHFAKKPKTPNKTTLCKHAGASAKVTMRGKSAMTSRSKGTSVVVQSHRIADSVTRLTNRGSSVKGHIAPFPVGLPLAYIESFSDAESLVLDPFIGSGTTILAAEKIGRIGYGMEKSPAYCELAIDRFYRQKAK